MHRQPPIIDQQMEPNKLKYNASSVTHQFPQIQAQSLQSESYSTVIEQAITTLDKSLLRELLTEADGKVIVKSVAGLTPAKASSLLGLLEGMLYEDNKNTQKYVIWLGELLKRHLGVILTNPENREIVSRMRKFIERKIQGRDTLANIKSKLTITRPHERKKYVPRFSYTESRDNTTPEKSEGEGEDYEKWAEDDDMMEEEFE